MATIAILQQSSGEQKLSSLLFLRAIAIMTSLTTRAMLSGDDVICPMNYCVADLLINACIIINISPAFYHIGHKYVPRQNRFGSRKGWRGGEVPVLYLFFIVEIVLILFVYVLHLSNISS